MYNECSILSAMLISYFDDLASKLSRVQVCETAAIRAQNTKPKSF